MSSSSYYLAVVLKEWLMRNLVKNSHLESTLNAALGKSIAIRGNMTSPGALLLIPSILHHSGIGKNGRNV